VLTDFTSYLSLSFTFVSSVFGSGFPKYYPLSAMNGFRMVLTLAPPNVAFQCDDICDYATAALHYSITDPTLHTSMVRVDPSVDRGLLVNMAGKDGKIRIPTTSWRQYKMAVYGSDQYKSFIVPFSVSSLKALYFAFVPAVLDGSLSSTSMFSRNLTQYQAFVGSVPIPVTPVIVKPPFNEAVAELLRAVHVKLNDTNWPSLMRYPDFLTDYTAPTAGQGLGAATSWGAQSNLFFGVELESFNGKNNAIECGANVLNNNIELRFTFSTTSDNTYNLVVFGYHDVFIVIDPSTGITSLEF
jgi:hypothetical protein